MPETSTRATQSTEALEAYLKGKEAYGPRSAEGIKTAITELSRAVTLDPEFAVAHAKLARAYALAREYAGLDVAYAYPPAQIQINRALALAPTDWDVLAEYAWFLSDAQRMSFGDKTINLDQVVAAFDAAITANPNNADAHRGKGWTLVNNDRLDEARSSLERAKELNPRDPLIYLNLTAVAWKQGNIKEALKLATVAVRQNPTALYARSVLSAAYQELGDIETAHRVWQSCRVESACAVSLWDLFIQLGIESDDPKLLGDYTVLDKFYAAGRYDEFAQEVATLNAVSLIGKVEMYTDVGAWDEAYSLIQNNPAVFEPVFKGVSSSYTQTIRNEIALLAVLQNQDDPRAKGVRASLAKKYQGVVPGEHIALDIYFNGAAWRILEGDLDGAMVWLNAMADQGRFLYYFSGNSALLDRLKSRPDYQAFRARMDSYRTRDRSLIEAQIANPPEFWWSPDELQAD
ncbi:MAG: tetratricopeptide (TPR) repeat protein [Polaribacter sp.]